MRLSRKITVPYSALTRFDKVTTIKANFDYRLHNLFKVPAANFVLNIAAVSVILTRIVNFAVQRMDLWTGRLLPYTDIQAWYFPKQL